MYFGYNLGARVFSEVLGSIGILVAIGTSTLCTMSRWFSNDCFHPELREDCVVDEHISQMGWFNHQSGYVYIYIHTNIYLFIFTQIYIYIYVSAKIYLTRHNLITYMFLFILPSFIQPPKKTNKGSTKFDLHAAAFRDLALPSYFVRAERHSYTVSVELPMV